MEPNMPSGVFINNITDDFKDHIELIRKLEDKYEYKNISKKQLYIT